MASQGKVGYPSDVSDEVVAVVQELVVALVESSHKAKLEVCHCVGILIGRASDLVSGSTEAEATVRLEHVGHVEFAQLNVSAKGDVVGSLHPVQIVVEGVVVAEPTSER